MRSMSVTRLLNTLPTDSRLMVFFVTDNLSYYLSNNLLFNTKVPCSVASVALPCKLPQFYTNFVRDERKEWYWRV